MLFLNLVLFEPLTSSVSSLTAASLFWRASTSFHDPGMLVCLRLPRKPHEHWSLTPLCSVNPLPHPGGLPNSHPPFFLANPTSVWVASVSSRVNHDWVKSVKPSYSLWQWLVFAVGVWPRFSQWGIRKSLRGANGKDFPLGRHKGENSFIPITSATTEVLMNPQTGLNHVKLLVFDLTVFDLQRNDSFV